MDTNDPLALFGHGKAAGRQAGVGAPPPAKASAAVGPAGTVGILSPIQGTLFKVEVKEGDTVVRGQRLEEQCHTQNTQIWASNIHANPAYCISSIKSSGHPARIII